MKRLNKKGSLDDMSIPVMLIMVCFAIFGAYMIVTSALPAFAGDATATNLLANGKLMISRIGNTSFIFIAVALILFSVIGSFLMITHPVFMIVDIILLPLSVLVASIMSNAYESSLYTMAVASNFPAMSFVMLHLPLLIVVTSVLSTIAAYALVKQ